MIHASQYHGFDIAVAIETIGAGVEAKLSFVPGGQFQGHIRRYGWFLAAKTKAGADIEAGDVVRENERRVSIVVPIESGVMDLAAQNAGERDELARIE